MEELRSTDNLDREIIEDARRKAEKVARDADRECADIAARVSAMVRERREEKERELSRLVESHREDARSRLPLEMARRNASFVDAKVLESLDAWFASLKSERRVSLYETLIERYARAIGHRRVKVRAAGISEAEARTMIERVLGPGSVVSLSVLDRNDARKEGFTNGLVLEAEDRSVSCRATDDELSRVILEDRREEIARALFGGRLPE